MTAEETAQSPLSLLRLGTIDMRHPTASVE